MALVLGEGARLVAIGVACGIAAAVLVGRLLETLLFDVAATDVASLAAAAAAFGLVATHGLPGAGLARRTRRRQRRPAAGLTSAAARPACAILVEAGPGLRVLHQQRREVEPHVLGRIAATIALAAFSSVAGSGFGTSSVSISPSSCLMPSPSRKAPIIGRCVARW